MRQGSLWSRQSQRDFLCQNGEDQLVRLIFTKQHKYLPWLCGSEIKNLRGGEIKNLREFWSTRDGKSLVHDWKGSFNREIKPRDSLPFKSDSSQVSNELSRQVCPRFPGLTTPLLNDSTTDTSYQKETTAD